jgi:hypothetical protein
MCVPKNSLSWRDVVLLAWGGTHPQQDPGEVCIPHGAGQEGTQGVLQKPVEALRKAIGLRVVGGGLHVPDAQDDAEAVSEG